MAKRTADSHVGQEREWHLRELISKAIQIDTAMRTAVPADWKGDDIKEREVRRILRPLVDGDRDAASRLFELVKSQAGYR